MKGMVMSPLLLARNSALAVAAALVTALGLNPYDFVVRLTALFA
jgi:hypothetical protein